MKYIIILFLIVSFQINSFSQFDLGWKTQITTAENCNTKSFLLIDNILLFNLNEFDVDMDILTNLLLAYDATSGEELWRYDLGEDFPLHVTVELFPAASNQFYFVINNSHANQIDHYGLMDTDMQVLWQNQVNFNSQINATSIAGNLYLDRSQTPINKMSKVDIDGNINWTIEDGIYDAWNSLLSNGEDRLYWLNETGLNHLDTLGNILETDSTNTYNKFYSTFIAKNEKLHGLTWGIQNFDAIRYQDDLSEQESRIISFPYNIFDVPNPTIMIDQNQSTYYASDYDYDGKSFLVKFDSNLDQEWELESADAIANIFESESNLIVIKNHSIELLEKSNGNMLHEFFFTNNESLINRKAKNQSYSIQNKELYLFTQDNDKYYINQLLNNTTSTTEPTTSSNNIIFPNPTLKYLNIRNPIGIKEIMIYNVLGEKMSIDQPHTGKFDVSHLPAGHYFLIVNTAYGSESNKFIKL